MNHKTILIINFSLHLTSNPQTNLNMKFSLLAILILFYCNAVFAQVGINSDNSLPDPSAGLDVKYSDKGILIPRMTIDQRDALPDPAEGLIIFCIDCGTEGSLSYFSNGSWKSFSLCSSAPPPSSGNQVSPGQIVWNWEAVSGAAGYKWNTTNDYSTAEDMETANSKTETGIACDMVYIRYVWSYNDCSVSPANTLIETISNAAPSQPLAGVHIPYPESIVWNWEPVSGATGYKWGIVNDFATAEDMYDNTTKTETGLTSDFEYTRYVWAYNGCGYSSPVVLIQTTIAVFVCGNNVIKNHIAGNVAPVDKSVSYGTVTNVPGETSKCWITSNLGADQQATAVSDNTEASAGWYWQFNLMQGYKHDGTNRIPNTAWITSISENSGWTAPNDPCSIELGSVWHIPTQTEWSNVNSSGGWTDWNGPWGSALKLHAAGYIYFTDGNLYNRGAWGFYWSNSQSSNTEGGFLMFYNASCGVNTADKAYGHSLRCLRN
jgi:hypothetical protein